MLLTGKHDCFGVAFFQNIGLVNLSVDIPSGRYIYVGDDPVAIWNDTWDLKPEGMSKTSLNRKRLFTMKVYLIKASAPGPFKEYKKAMGAPPQNIFSIAAATPEGIEIIMCDETIGMKPKLGTDADIVALFFHTSGAPH